MSDHLNPMVAQDALQSISQQKSKRLPAWISLADEPNITTWISVDLRALMDVGVKHTYDSRPAQIMCDRIICSKESLSQVFNILKRMCEMSVLIGIIYGGRPS